MANLTPWADRLIRVIYREYFDGNAKIIEMIDRLNDMNADEPEEVSFEETSAGWVRQAA